MVGPAVTPGKRYQDFEIIIERSGDTVYPVRCRAPNGATGHSAFDFPFTGVDLQLKLGLIERSLLSSLLKLRRVPQEEQPIQEFGRQLFEALFTGEVRELYTACLSSLSEDCGLRVRLSIEEPQLAALPWEFLYDLRQRNYLCLSTRTPLVRQIDLPRATGSLAVKFPLRVLGMVASPSNQDTLNIEAEQTYIQNALAGPIKAGQVQLEWLSGSSWRDLQLAMRRGPWHVFHFIGHGGFDAKREEGYISLVNAQGRSFDLYASDLAMLLGDHPSLRLVVLNACQGGRSASGLTNDQFTSTAAALLNAGIPAVLAMQYAITDNAAVELARAFYGALVEEAPVEAALTEARKAIRLTNQSLEWAVPVLYSRTTDGVLYHKTQEDALAEQKKPFKPRFDFDHKTRQMTFWLGRDVPLELVYVAEGPFQMGASVHPGSPLNGDEKPAHSVQMYPYWIARYPLTRAQLAAIQAGDVQPGELPPGREGRLPAVMLTCASMWALCSRLNNLFATERFAPFSFNLPTEAEWEKAARGSEDWLYPYGNSTGSGLVNSADLKLNALTPVGQFSPRGDSPYGCVDMAGSVWEMTRTLDAVNHLHNLISLKWVYPFKHDDGRNTNRDPKAPYIIRGGSYKETAERCNAVIRDWQYGDQPREDIGFRLVLSPLDINGRLPAIKSMQPVFEALAALAQK